VTGPAEFDLWDELAPKCAAPQVENATVTVIVPVRNEDAFVARTLEQLLDQELMGIELEILVIDGQSTDHTRKVVAQYAQRDSRIRLLENPRRLSSIARNLAIHDCSSAYVVIIDGHCEVPSRRYFLDLVHAFESSGADCLGRPQPLDVAEATPLQRAIALARASRLGHHPESFIYCDRAQFVPAKSVAVAYRREVFDKVGLFDETFDAHEDGEFNYRCDQARLSCYLDPRLTVKYHPRDSLAGLFRQMVRYGRGRARFALKHPGTWAMSSLLPMLLVLYIPLGTISAAVIPLTQGPCLMILAIYCLILLANGVLIALRHRSTSLIWKIPLVQATIHLGAGAGILGELLCHRPGSVTDPGLGSCSSCPTDWS
jgi:succinoglycan biosynthesis protein ExoA